MRSVVLAYFGILLHGVLGCYDGGNFFESDLHGGVVILEGVVKMQGKQVICEESGSVKLIKSTGRVIDNLQHNVALVSVNCQSQGQIKCSAQKVEECQVYITGLNSLAQQNCGDIPLTLNKSYTIYGVSDDKLQGCKGVYEAKHVIPLNQSIQKDDQGRCLKQETGLKAEGRRLLQIEDEINSTAQCGLFGVDVTYCAPEGLVTDKANARVVIGCNKQVSGICSECLKVEGPKNGTVEFVIPVGDSGKQHEIKVLWEEKYLGAVSVSTEECDLVDISLQQMVSPITPMKFTRVPFVMIKPAGYTIH